MNENVFFIKSILIENFMSIRKYEVDFEDFNEFLGFNGVGKTTILNAINWCLFGKDIYDSKKFDIYPIENGEVRKDLHPSVTIKVNINNEKVYNIRRFYEGEGKSAKVEAGVGESMVKLSPTKEYPKFLMEKLDINDTEFKMLSNINYAISLPQNDLKNLIVNLIGDISDSEMFENEDVNKKYKAIKEQVLLSGTEVLEKNLSSSKSTKKKEEIEKSGAIKQEEVNIEKYNFDDENIEALKNRQKELYDIINDYENKVEIEREKEKNIINVKDEIRKKETKLERLKYQFQSKNQSGVSLKKQLETLNNVDYLRKKDMNEVDMKILELNTRVKQLENNLSTQQKQKNKIKEEFDKLKGIEIVVDKDTCDYCGQKLPPEKINNILEVKKKHHEEYLDGLLEKHKEISKTIEQIEKEINVLKESGKSFIEEKNKILSKDYSNSFDDENTMKIKEDMNNLRNEMLEIKKQSQELSIEINNLNDKLNLLPKLQVISSSKNVKDELENINLKLSNYNYINEHKNNLKTLIEENEKIRKDLIAIDYIEQLLKDYKTLKSELMTNKLQENFRYIKFKTKEMNKTNNKIVDCFKVTMNDKDYYSLSGGEKIRASIDLIIGIQNLKHKKVPLLIDCMGELDRFPDFVNTQVICCRAVQKPNADNPNYNKLLTTYSQLRLNRQKIEKEND